MIQNKIISLLVPTRNRFSFVKRMVDSIINTSSDSNNYEILFAVDNDDSEAANNIDAYLKEKNINYNIIFFERLYYKNFNLYLDGLYKHAKGELLWTFPDDVEIKTHNWDLILKEYKNEMYLMVDLGLQWQDWPFSIIPIISRKWIETTGGFGINSQTDLWLGEIAKELNIIKKIPICCEVFFPANGNQHNVQDFLSEKVQNEKYKHLEKIKSVLKQK